MRRLDVRPQKKLRNPARHLRRLAQWPQRIVDQIPQASQLDGERFWNFKIPVFSKVCDPPHATPETQRACLAALFATAAAIEQSPGRPPNSRIAVLATTPFLFESEVTIFVDEDYFRSFLQVPATKRADFDGGWIEASPADGNEIAALRPPEPAGLAFMGGTKLVEFEAEWPDRLITRINWVWAFPRR
jgi:hypothetical protein